MVKKSQCDWILNWGSVQGIVISFAQEQLEKFLNKEWLKKSYD